jgi:hypothetical protein
MYHLQLKCPEINLCFQTALPQGYLWQVFGQQSYKMIREKEEQQKFRYHHWLDV